MWARFLFVSLFVCLFCFVVVVVVTFVLTFLPLFCLFHFGFFVCLFVFRFYHTSGIRRDKCIILDNRTLTKCLFTLGLRREKKKHEKKHFQRYGIYIHCRYSQSIVTLSFFSERNGPGNGLVYPSSNRIKGHSPSCEWWSVSSEFVAPR